MPCIAFVQVQIERATGLSVATPDLGRFEANREEMLRDVMTVLGSSVRKGEAAVRGGDGPGAAANIVGQPSVGRRIVTTHAHAIANSEAGSACDLSAVDSAL
jgi:hypothetical protein